MYKLIYWFLNFDPIFLTRLMILLQNQNFEFKLLQIFTVVNIFKAKMLPEINIYQSI